VSYLSSTTIPNSKSTLPRPSIVEVVEHSGVHLRRAGKELLGLCPLHDEKSPSFSVNPDKEKFYCHGCHAGGDVFAYVMQLKGLTFVEAKSYLGVDGPRRFLKPMKSAERIAAEVVTAWSRKTSLVLSAKMREIGRREQMASMALNTGMFNDLND